MARGDNDARLLTEQGFGREGELVLAANPRPRPDACVIPAGADGLLDQFAVVSTPDRGQEAVEPWDDLDAVTSFGLPPGADPEVLENLVRAVAPSSKEI